MPKAAASSRRATKEEATPATTTTPHPVEPTEVAEVPKIIMSKAQRRKLKKPPVVVTAEMKERAREDLRELRKHMRMLKSNGARRKLNKLRAKRQREEGDNEEALNAFDSDYQRRGRGRRLE